MHPSGLPRMNSQPWRPPLWPNGGAGRQGSWTLSMISDTTEAFRRQVRELPESVRSVARQAYRRWLSNPRHPSLQFKRIHLH